jgi:hypothetical protein
MNAQDPGLTRIWACSWWLVAALVVGIALVPATVTSVVEAPFVISRSRRRA